MGLKIGVDRCSLRHKGPWATILNEKALKGWKQLVGIPIEGKELQRRAYIIWQKEVYRKKAALLFTEELTHSKLPHDSFE